MIELAILLMFNSLLCLGVWNAANYEVKKVWNVGGNRWDEEEIKGVLWFLEKWAKDKWFYKPLCGCLPCMASFHSIYPYWTYMYAANAINIHAVLFYPIYILALSGLNRLIEELT